MYCPKCSQPKVSDEMNFCSRCGLPLEGVEEIVTAGGTTGPGAVEEKLSPRQKGVRQGVMLMALSVILIPAYILLAALFPADDRLVESSPSDTPFEKISQAVLFTTFMLGLARLLYARFFQPGARPGRDEAEVAHLGGATKSDYALPPAQSIPADGFGAWRANTGEVAHATRAKERTTKSLGKE